MKKVCLFFFLLASNFSKAQINVNKHNFFIKTQLSDTLIKVYQDFLNNEVDKISMVELLKKYDKHEYQYFLETKKFYQSKRNWITQNSYEESIIIQGEPFEISHIDSMIFDYRFKGVDMDFVKSEIFLDSSESQMVLNEIFDGVTNEIITFCYNPRHAILFYNSAGKVVGIYEICFECSNVTFGIFGTVMLSKSSPKIASLFQKMQTKTREN